MPDQEEKSWDRIGSGTRSSPRTSARAAAPASICAPIRKYTVTKPSTCIYETVRPGATDCGFKTVKLSMALGSWLCVVFGFGKLSQFAFDQPGTPMAVDKQPLPAPDIPNVCRVMGARVEIAGAFELDQAQAVLQGLMYDAQGVRVLFLRQALALTLSKWPQRLSHIRRSRYLPCRWVRLQPSLNTGLKYPGLKVAPETRKEAINMTCFGCGVCASICPSGAIKAALK